MTDQLYIRTSRKLVLSWFESMHVDVVGGSGFIGTRFCRRLAAHGRSFAIIDKQESAEFPTLTRLADVRSVAAVRECVSQRAALVNLAAEHRDDVRPLSLYEDVNVTGARNLCQVAREKNVTTIVFTSSVAVYGFAPVGTDEKGKVAPFNDYGRTKFDAEEIFRSWQSEAPAERSLVIVRPTVVFGEDNRGNVFNLLQQIASGRFVMVGTGENRKSMAYVENVAAFLEHALELTPGIHLYNFVDKPDFTMNDLVALVRKALGKSGRNIRLPYALGYWIGVVFDVVAKLTDRKFPVSAIRVKKFCTNSVFESAVATTGFRPPIPLSTALEQTIHYEFIAPHKQRHLYYSE